MRLLRRVARRNRWRAAEARTRDWLTPDPTRVRDEQLARLRDVWSDATDHVPYYRDLVDRGRAPRGIDSLEQFFAEVPVLERRALVDHPDGFRRERPPAGTSMTAGSTGSPLAFGYDRGEARHSAANVVTARIANGMRADDTMFLLWGHSHLLGTGLRGVYRHLVRRLKDGVLGQRRADAYHLEPEAARSHFAAMRSFRPRVVIGYSSALYALVRHNRERRHEARALGVRFVVATAEVFPDEDARAAVEDFFGCGVAMEYGGVEFGAVAHTLPGRGFTTFWWDNVLETLAEDAASPAPVAVTALYPRYTPLIRYRNGDEIRASPEEPGRSVLRFEAVEGRHNDALPLPDGSEVHSVGLFHCIHQERDVFNIQAVVDESGITILLAAADPAKDAVGRIRRRLADLNPALERCAIEIVPDLVTNRAGKRRWVVDRRGRDGAGMAT